MSAPAGTWPFDPATARTPIARNGADTRRLAVSARSAATLEARVSVCRACPRLVDWRETVARQRKRAFADQDYWGRPVPGFGDPHPKIMIIGLAPSAHGANRTGRNFTGDRSGDWLYAALHRVGLASQPESVSVTDGLELFGTRIAPAVRCAPPANLPTPSERETCRPWLERELQLAWPSLRSIVVLGGFGWQAVWPVLRELTGPSTSASTGKSQQPLPDHQPSFGHGVEVTLPGGRRMFGCFHVSPQNTNTGRLTTQMLDALLTRARDWATAA